MMLSNRVSTITSESLRLSSVTFETSSIRSAFVMSYSLGCHGEMVRLNSAIERTKGTRNPLKIWRPDCLAGDIFGVFTSRDRRTGSAGQATLHSREANGSRHRRRDQSTRGAHELDKPSEASL